jgi:hypothetical protein
MAWRLQAEQNDSATNGLHETTTSAETNIFYRLRQWLLSADYLYAIKRHDQSVDRRETEQRWMLRVSRTFVRIF